MGPKMVTLGQASPGAENLLQQGVERASRTPGEISESQLQGVDARSGSIGGDATQNAASTGQDPAFMQAIRNSFSGQAGGAIDALKRQNQMTAQFQKSDDMKKMAMFAMGQQQAITQHYSQVTNAYVQSQQARAQAVGQIFGLANSMIGMQAANHNRSQQFTNAAVGQELNAWANKPIGQMGGQTGGFAPQGMGSDFSNFG